MSQHIETLRKKQRLKLLKRIIDILINYNPSKRRPFILNKKEYYKLTFSGDQIINAMEQYVTFEEREQGLIPTDRSTFYKTEYKEILTEAKKKKLNLKSSTGLNLSNNLKDVELELQIQLMASEISKLKEENQTLEMILKKEEIIRTNDTYETLIYNSNDNVKDNQLWLLIQLIELNMDDGIIKIDTQNNNNKLLYYEGINKNEKLCNLSDLRNLDFKLVRDKGIEKIKGYNIYDKVRD